MTINELAEGTQLSIQIKLGKETVDFETKTISFIDRKVNKTLEMYAAKLMTFVQVIPAIKKGGKVINFLQPGIRVSVTAPQEGKLYLWQEGVSIRTVVLQETSYHLICCKAAGMTINRREHFRLDMGLTGVIQIGSNRKTDVAIIEDISENGIGMTVKPDVEEHLRAGAIVNLTFEDSMPDLRTNTELLLHYRFTAIVVRFLKNEENGMFFVGCRLNVNNPISAEGVPLSRYLNAVQRKRIADGKM